jgi:predicted deacylase
VLAPYRPLEEVLDEARGLGRAALYGTSAEGRPLLSVEVGEGERLLQVTAAIHGVEYIGVETALAVLRAGPIPGARLRVCPVLNPDAYARTWAQGGAGTLHELRRNAGGVDLNRNFPLPWSARPSWVPGSGSLDPAHATYRGVAPLSEPETAALVTLLHAEAPHASANLHSFMGTLICARVWHPRDWRGYSRLCRAFRRGQGQGRGLGYLRLGTPVLDVFSGELEDWQHHVQRTWAVCVECFSLPESYRQHLRAPSLFWRFNPRDPGSVVARDAAGVRAMLAASLDLPRPPERARAVRALPTWGG